MQPLEKDLRGVIRTLRAEPYRDANRTIQVEIQDNETCVALQAFSTPRESTFWRLVFYRMFEGRVDPKSARILTITAEDVERILSSKDETFSISIKPNTHNSKL